MELTSWQTPRTTDQWSPAAYLSAERITWYHISVVYFKRPIASHLQLSLRSHLHISLTNPKTNILSPVFMTNPRVHNIGMALLTPNSSLVYPDCPSPQQGIVGCGRWTENRPLSLSFRLNPWRFSQTLGHLQVWNGQHGSEEVAGGLLASHFMGRTLSYFPCIPSTLAFHHPIRVR